jgi:dTMP kinase
MQKGKFITIDGVEGAGKSTQITFIYEYLQSKGVNVVLTREPGGTDLGEKIRELLLNTKTKSMHGDSELLLMFSARNEHIHNKIIPALNNGDWVLSDRFTDASYAYQGGGRGLDIKRIEQLEKWVLQDLTPDMTLLLDIPVAQGMERIKSRGKKDRIELEEIDFFERVRQAYIARSKKYPERIKLIDSSKTKEHTSMQIAQILADL